MIVKWIAEKLNVSSRLVMAVMFGASLVLILAK